MPRAKVDPALRKRVARACDLCRKRKEKCTGGDPCPQCRERGTEAQCQYTPVQKTPYSPRPESIVNEEAPVSEVSSPVFKQRQRVVIACDACRKRKERCDGQKPACGACCVRGMEAACSYTPITPGQAQRASRPNAHIVLRPRDSVATSFGRGNIEGVTEHRASDAHLTPRVSGDGGTRSVESAKGNSRAHKSADSSLSSAPVPKLSRMLKDGKGGFVYVGDSSTASFLQSVRRHVSATLGPCKFTTEDARHTMPEESHRDLSHFQNKPEPTHDSGIILPIADQYNIAVSGLLDLFDQSWFMEKVNSWIESSPHTRSTSPRYSVIYLALAIGAQDRDNDWDEETAERLFVIGRKLAMANFMDSPSLMTVQAFTLISYYLLADHRRNAAFVNLGVAVRAAYALGIHRHEANAASPEDGLSRERIWKSLRALDLFMSASMGRPPATSEPDCNVPWVSLEIASNRDKSTVSAQASSALFRICDIIERILTEVYSKRSVSLELAGSISAKHREWTANVTKMLDIDGLTELQEDNNESVCRKFGSSVVTTSYYYSIILLARPFLEYRISAPQNTTTRPNSIVQSANIETYADACVDSAIKSIQLASDVQDRKSPKRQPMTINSIFASALCIGLAYFGDYDQRGWPLGRHLDSAITLLQRLGRTNIQAKKYAEICTTMEDATKAYTKRRDEKFLQSSNRHVRNVFGDLQTIESPQTNPSQQQSGQSGFLSQLVDAANASATSTQASQTPSHAPAAYMASATSENENLMQGVVQSSAADAQNLNENSRHNTFTELSSESRSAPTLSFGD